MISSSICGNKKFTKNEIYFHRIGSQTTTMERVDVVNSKTGIYTKIEDAKKGNEYACIKCSAPVIVREGDVRQKHYSHLATTTCMSRSSSSSSQSNTGETPDHYQSKIILKNCIDTKRNINVSRECIGLKCSVVESFEIPTQYATFTEIEHNLNPGVCDVYMETPTQSYIFEVFKSHKTTERSGIWFEIDSREIIQSYYEEGDLHFKCIRYWRCNDCAVKEAEQSRQYERTRITRYLKEYYTLDFGKYAGKDFRDLLESDPLYYKWVLDIEYPSHVIRGAQQRMNKYLEEWKRRKREVAIAFKTDSSLPTK